jgi:hypothetical protein
MATIHLAQVSHSMFQICHSLQHASYETIFAGSRATTTHLRGNLLLGLHSSTHDPMMSSKHLKVPVGQQYEGSYYCYSQYATYWV